MAFLTPLLHISETDVDDTVLKATGIEPGARNKREQTLKAV